MLNFESSLVSRMGGNRTYGSKGAPTRFPGCVPGRLVGLPVIFFLLACTSTPLTADTPGLSLVEVEHEAGRAFVWGKVQLTVVPETTEEWLWGIYLEGEHLAASWSEREWLGVPGWIPLLLVIPDPDSITLSSDRLMVQGEGSAEHGCDPAALLSISFSSDEDVVTVSIQIDGVPYLALPPEGTGDIDGFPVDLSSLEQETFLDISQATFETPFSDVITVTYDTPIPWLELAAHDQVVEVDIDHSCEKSARTTFSSELKLMFSSTPSESSEAQ
jgi:hypothetical protein